MSVGAYDEADSYTLGPSSRQEQWIGSGKSLGRFDLLASLFPSEVLDVGELG